MQHGKKAKIEQRLIQALAQSRTDPSLEPPRSLREAPMEVVFTGLQPKGKNRRDAVDPTVGLTLPPAPLPPTERFEEQTLRTGGEQRIMDMMGAGRPRPQRTDRRPPQQPAPQQQAPGGMEAMMQAMMQEEPAPAGAQAAPRRSEQEELQDLLVTG